MWYLIVSIPDLCTLTYFYYNFNLAAELVSAFSVSTIMAWMVGLCSVSLEFLGHTHLVLPVIFQLHTHKHLQTLTKSFGLNRSRPQKNKGGA